jgi:hypothetical protein
MQPDLTSPSASTPGSGRSVEPGAVSLPAQGPGICSRPGRRQIVQFGFVAETGVRLADADRIV